MPPKGGRLPGSVLVTGGLGFIGSHLVRALLEQGCAVRVLDDRSTGSSANLSGVKGDLDVVVADVADQARVRNAAKGMEAVVHLAAVLGVRSNRRRSRMKEVNVGGTRTVLESMAAAGVDRLVLASSVAVYGERRTSMGTANRSALLSTYARTKAEAEALCERHALRSGALCFALRLANVYGPRLRVGADASVMAQFARSVARTEPLRIYGDGRQTRDFVHVSDVVRAILVALSIERRGFSALDIGTGKATSINHLARTFLRCSGTSLPVEHVPALGEVRASRADTGQAWRLLRFRSEVPLQEGVQELIGWYLGAYAPLLPRGQGFET